jgi:hypothetical protein
MATVKTTFVKAEGKVPKTFTACAKVTLKKNTMEMFFTSSAHHYQKDGSMFLKESILHINPDSSKNIKG